MRLIKLLRRIYRNKIEILDLNDEVLFRGLYDSQTALTVKLLSAQIIDFGPSLIFCADIEPEDIGKFSSYYEAYRHDKSEYNKLKSFLQLNSRVSKRMNDSKSNNTDLDVAVELGLMKCRMEKSFTTCIGFANSIPTRIKVDILKEQLDAE